MKDHSVKSDMVIHGIPDMSETPLRKLILCIAASRLADADTKACFETLTGSGEETNDEAIQAFETLFAAPRDEASYIEGLQYMGAAFTQAYALDTAAPESLSQSQWNRALRDQGERLRAASLTLGSGRVAIAAEQLSAVSQFLKKHIADLPA